MTNNITTISDISDIYKLLENDLSQVDELINQNSQSKINPLTSQVAANIVKSKGKRLRPILTILATKISNQNHQLSDYLKLASAVELIHSATLLHDDVIDNSQKRRGQETANYVWGNKASILVGDFLFSTAFKLMVQSKSIDALESLANSAQIITDGEIMQLQISNDITISRQQYLQIAECKTAALFASACQVGAIITNQDQVKIDNFYHFGINLGICFQIVDDILDYSAQNDQVGKNIGDDFFEGKITLPIILTYQSANLSEKEEIKNIFARNIKNTKKDDDKLDYILNIMDKYNSINLAKKIVGQYQQKAINCLDNFEDSIYLQALKFILQFSVNRIY